MIKFFYNRLQEEKNASLAELDARRERIEKLRDSEENNTSYVKSIKNLEEKIEKLKKDIVEMDNEKQRLQLEIEELENEIEEHEGNLKKGKQDLINYKKVDEKRTDKLRKIKQELSELENSMNAFERKKSEKSREKHDLLLQAKVNYKKKKLI